MLPELNTSIRLNTFTGNIEMTNKVPWSGKRSAGDQWTDTDVVLLKYHLAKTKKIEFSVALLWEALHTAAVRHSYHPIREYIEAIQWDGKPRLNTWLTDYCGAQDNAYTQTVGRKAVLGMIARVFEPGVQFDSCLILEGAQGIGKSTICSILGGKWYGDLVVDPHARDTVDAMRGKWLIELSEMEVTKRAEVQALRAFISRRTDRTRLAYERTTKDFPRQCVFVGTVNPDGLGYLSDTTGNRRFWPIKCGDTIDTAGFREVRDQIIAEAYVAYRKKEDLFLGGDVAKLAEIEQKERMTDDPWGNAIHDWLVSTPATLEVTIPQIWELVLGGQIKNLTRVEQSRIGRALKDLRFYKQRARSGDLRYTIYRREEKEMRDHLKELGVKSDCPF